MKKPIDLKEHFFEKLEVILPSFPGLVGKPINIDSVSGKHVIYFHKKEPSKVALRWILSIHPKTVKARLAFRVSVSIVGVFEVASSKTKKDAAKLVIKAGPPLLYEIVKSTIDRILFRSLLKPPQLPSIKFGKANKKRLAAT